MADFDNDGMRFFVKATDEALQDVTNAACIGCANQNGQPYLIHYARQTEQKQTNDTVITSYTDIRARAVSLCETCLTQYQQTKRKEWALKLLAFLIPLIIALVAAVFIANDMRELMIIVAALAGMLASVCIYNLIVYNSPEKAARILALELSKEGLEREGYDSFWHNLDIESMRSEIGSMR